jgi:hypothetical protein
MVHSPVCTWFWSAISALLRDFIGEIGNHLQAEFFFGCVVSVGFITIENMIENEI